MSDMKLTSNQVKCSRCVNCISNPLRIQMDDPRKYAEVSYSCKWCYVERIKDEADILLKKATAMTHCIYAFRDRFHKSFTCGIRDDFVRSNVKRHRIMREWASEMKRISAMRDDQEIEAVSKKYGEEYFGKEGK